MRITLAAGNGSSQKEMVARLSQQKAGDEFYSAWNLVDIDWNRLLSRF